MDLRSTNDNFSDDEVFFGSLSIKEIKKHIFMDKHQTSVSTVADISAENLESLHLIETQSEPDMYNIKDSLFDLTLSSDVRHNFSSVSKIVSNKDTISDNICVPLKEEASRVLDIPSDVVDFIINPDSAKQECLYDANISITKLEKPNINDITDSLRSPDSDESFLKLEKMVSKLCMSPDDGMQQVLDSTLDVVDFILNNNPSKELVCNNTSNKIVQETENVCINLKMEDIPDVIDNLYPDVLQIETNSRCTNTSADVVIPIKKNSDDINNDREHNPSNIKLDLKSSKTPFKNTCTPSSRIKPDHIFITPKTISSQNQSANMLRKTPGKSKSYQHITSPIASYIKNYPQAPLLKEVHPKKPLPASAIPKPVKTPMKSKADNENFQLPSLAYKSAKKTEMISVPDKSKISQTQWIKKFTNPLPKPAVIQHNYRQMNSAVKSSQSDQENSFANLTLHQAELSVCMQKPAFKNL